MIEFVTSHAAELMAAASLVLSLAVLVTKLTPTTKDDEIVAKVIDALGHVGIKPKA